MVSSPERPSFSNRNPEPSARQLLTLLGLFLGAIAVVVWLVGWLLNGLIWLIPPEAEQALGALVVPIYEQQAQPSEVQMTLNDLLDRLEEQLGEDEQRDYRVLYVPEETVNAIAIPGNRIVIYRGLLAEVESENELMMVLGHELGHFAHRDHLRGLGRALLLRLAIASFFGDGTVLQGAAGTAIEAISNSQYSQSQEKQADRFGLMLLQATYGQVGGATDFFARLAQKPGANIAFLNSHPAPQERVKELERLIRDRSYKIGDRQELPPSLQALSGPN